MAIGWRTVAWVMIANLIGGVAVAGETNARPAVVIHLDNMVQMPDRELGAAKAEMEHVFRTAGVDVVWTDATGLRGLTLILVNATGPSGASGPDDRDVAGAAMRLTRRAYVFPDRLTAASRNRQTDAPVVLGRVMAHEIGHLLLPAGSHSRQGIMRAHVDFSQVGVHCFAADQAQAIRLVLSDTSARP
jgi:hypothetical protein